MKMAYYYSYKTLVLSCIISLSLACEHPDLPLKAASLGNWLVIEGWMKPSMFDGIPNNDLLDGTQLQFKSMKLQKYLCAEQGGGSVLVANRTVADDWETFRLWRINETFFNIRVFNKQFLGLENHGVGGNNLVATADRPGDSEIFQIVRKDGDPNLVRFKSSNGLFLQAKSETEVTADHADSSSWDNDDPSVFNMTNLGGMQGEYQITNGYGPAAAKFMQNHWNTYITEEDFKFMSENGINAVRIPIGWWLTHDPTPPKPFVGGASKALDNAFKWAEKYKLKVIVDLHALRVSQNGYQHSASRDGYQEWGASDIPETVAVIDFIAARYANHSALAAIELMNEPLAPHADLDALKQYYKAGYDTVRKYSSNVYVILSNRLNSNQTEFLSLAKNRHRVVVDVHYYNLFSDWYGTLSPQGNIDFIYGQRFSNLSAVTTFAGPLSFVGEWVAEWEVNNASKRDYQKFAKAQLDVYRRATFGWSYWAYKCDSNHWSLRWMIENGYIKL